jgi:type I restriction enzyme S subunit
VSELPMGWTASSLGQLCTRIVDGSHNPPKASEAGQPMLSARNIQGRRILFDDFRWISEREFDIEHARTQVTSGDVLLTIVGTIGRTAVVSSESPRFALQRSVAVLKAQGTTEPRYLAYVLESPDVQRYLEENAKGTAQKGIYLGALGLVEVPVAPLPEQKRIAGKLDALLARVDACRGRLDRVPAILKRFRQSVLAAATSGELTREWREARGRVDAEYELRPLGDLVREPLRNGKSVRDGDGPMVLRLSSLRSGTIDWREAKAGEWGDIDVERFLVEDGDFLVARGNGTRDLVGRGCLVAGAPPRVAFPDTMIRVRLDPDRIVPRFLKLIWDAEGTRSQIEFSARTTAGIWKVAQPDLEGIRVPVPALDEQGEIVRRAEELLALASKFENRCDAGRSFVGRLTPSLLAKAFRGELVPQDPSDEPASALLARLKGAPEAGAKKRKGKSAKA